MTENNDNKSIQEKPVVKQVTGMARLKNYMLSPEVKQRFADMMGKDGIYYLNQVMTAVSASEDLQKCEPASILIAAMRAASLKLSVDPALGQAWIIPYKNYKHGNVLEAQYQTGYKGIRELALRTRLYVALNVVDVYDTDVLEEDRMTGNLRFVLTEVSGNIIRFDPQRHGHANDKNIVGYMLYFKLTNGFSKTFYMSKNEIAEHAAHYAPGNYNNPKSKRNDPFERPTMERKTVLMNGLRRYGVFNDNDRVTLEQIEDEQDWIDPIQIPLENEVTPPAKNVISNLKQLGASIGVDIDVSNNDKPDQSTLVQEAEKMASEPKTARPMKPEQLLETIQNKVKYFEQNPSDKFKDAWQKSIVMNIEREVSEYVEDKTAVRRAILNYLVGKEHSADLTQAETTALWKWLGVHKDGELWDINADTKQEIDSLVRFLAPQN